MPAVLKGWNRRLSLVQVMYLMGGLAEVWHLIIPFRPLGMYWTVWVNTTLALSASGGSIIVWTFQDFSITQILREINFGELRSSTTAAFTILGALNFVNLVIFSLQKMQKCMKIKIQSL